MELLLMAWSADLEEWVKVQCDEDGNLLVDMANINLADLGDVDAETPGDGEFLVYDLASGTWVARALADGDIPAGIARDTEVVAAISAHADNASAHHARYSDAEAVSAMGAKADSNPLNHDRYTDGEATVVAQTFTGKGARVSHSESQTIEDDTPITVAFDTEVYDTDGIHDTETNNYRLTCKTAGIYLVISYGLIWGAGAGLGSVDLYKNETDNVGHAEVLFTDGAPYGYPYIATMIDLEVDDYVSLTAYQESGGEGGYYGDAPIYPSFMMQRIG